MLADSDPSSGHATAQAVERYARCVEASKRIRWDIERDVIRGRASESGRKPLPDSLSKLAELPFLDPRERRLFVRVQARTYAHLFEIVERSIGAKALELTRDYWLGDRMALEALVRLADESLKHQHMFRRLAQIAAEAMPDGYRCAALPDDVARLAFGRSTWAVLALTLAVELRTQAHYRSSIEPDAALSALWKDALLFHWKEESQHAVVIELEWRREHARLAPEARERSVGDFADLVRAVDRIVRAQARADAGHFLSCSKRKRGAAERAGIRDVLLKAYRWQHLASGLLEPRFAEVLSSLTTPRQRERIDAALGPILAHAGG